MLQAFFSRVRFPKGNPFVASGYAQCAMRNARYFMTRQSMPTSNAPLALCFERRQLFKHIYWQRKARGFPALLFTCLVIDYAGSLLHIVQNRKFDCNGLVFSIFDIVHGLRIRKPFGAIKLDGHLITSVFGLQYFN